MIEQIETGAIVIGSRPLGGDCHSNAIRDPLAKWAGRGFDSTGPAVFGVSWTLAVELTESLDVFQRNGWCVNDFVVRAHGLGLSHVEHRVQQH